VAGRWSAVISSKIGGRVHIAKAGPIATDEKTVLFSLAFREGHATN
jgi:hypothetical protein